MRNIGHSSPTATDQQDAEFASRGYQGTRKNPHILDAAGGLVWDLSSFDFLHGEQPTTVHSGLWRHASLLAKHGLFQVTERVWQVRGFDCSAAIWMRQWLDRYRRPYHQGNRTGRL